MMVRRFQIEWCLCHKLTKWLPVSFVMEIAELLQGLQEDKKVIWKSYIKHCFNWIFWSQERFNSKQVLFRKNKRFM